jgi:hypothetical protein
MQKGVENRWENAVNALCGNLCIYMTIVGRVCPPVVLLRSKPSGPFLNFPKTFWNRTGPIGATMLQISVRGYSISVAMSGPLPWSITLTGPDLLLVLLVYVYDLLDLVVATQEYSRPIVNVLGNNLKHSLHVAVNRLTTSCYIVSRKIKPRKR